jgi:imidazolonepropionase-like amidohydrolase
MGYQFSTRINAITIGIALFFSSSVSGIAQEATGHHQDVVIRHALIFDGKKVFGRGDVWIQNGRIQSIGKDLKVPADVEVIDATGDTLLPGLIDSHTHAYDNAFLKEALVFGVTTELDMFTDPHYAAGVKKEQAEGKDLNMADLRSAGYLATVPGGHGTEYGMDIPTLTSPGEAQAWVDARIAEGSDYIKIVYDNFSAYGMHRPTLSKKTMAAIISAAHKRGKLTVVHIGDQQGAKDAIDAGTDGLAHLFADSEPTADFVPSVVAHHAFVVPTLTVLESLSGTPSHDSLTADSRLTPYLSPDDITNLKNSFKFSGKLSEKYAEDTVRELIAARVPVLAGTDAPNPGTTHGASMHRELELLVRAGMSPEQALAAATSVPAKEFHLDDRGEIAPGKRADMLLVKGDPTHDITATRNIVAVWKVGIQDDRAAYQAAITKQQQQAEKTATATTQALSGSGIISDFESGKTDASFGAGWSFSTDSIAGGKSTGEMKVLADGASGTKHSLDISGEIDGALPYAWSGVMFSPGSQPFVPANLSTKKNLTFWAKGDGKIYRVMMFTESGGRIPAQQTFTAGTEWKQYSFPLSAFNGTDGHDVSAILFVGGPQPGKFDFQIDEIRLQ